MKIDHLEQEALFSSMKYRGVKERTKKKRQTQCKTHFKSHALYLLSPVWERECILFCHVIRYYHIKKC